MSPDWRLGAQWRWAPWSGLALQGSLRICSKEAANATLGGCRRASTWEGKEGMYYLRWLQEVSQKEGPQGKAARGLGCRQLQETPAWKDQSWDSPKTVKNPCMGSLGRSRREARNQQF